MHHAAAPQWPAVCQARMGEAGSAACVSPCHPCASKHADSSTVRVTAAIRSGSRLTSTVISSSARTFQRRRGVCELRAVCGEGAHQGGRAIDAAPIL